MSLSFEALENIFYPNSKNQKERMVANNLGLAHYSSAEACINIIKSKSIWLRSVAAMNDFSEVKHGRDQVRSFFMGSKSQKFRFIDAVKSIYPFFEFTDFNAQATNWMNGLPICNVHTASFTEHDDISENNGRLSMWRGYGSNNARAALVFAGLHTTRIPGASYLIAPVAYFSEEEFLSDIDLLCDNLEKNSEALRSMAYKTVEQWLLTSFYVYTVTLKHKSFEEEKEWRIVYLNTNVEPHHGISRSVEVINGIPQLIHSVSFEIASEQSSYTLNNFLRKVIIGPSQYSDVIVPAFAEVLRTHDVSCNIVKSLTPLRD